ncbi:hypothetical protein McaMca56_002294 [Microsporum canis]
MRWNLPIWRNEQEKVKGDIPEGKEENYQAIRIAEADLGIRVDMIQQAKMQSKFDKARIQVAESVS